MINPKTVLIATPSIDGKVEAGYCAGLASVFASGFAGNIAFLLGNSDIGSARCQIADQFLKSDFQWLVCIDADIQFSAQDFGRLMSVEPDPMIGGEMLRYTRLPNSEETIAAYDVLPELAVCAEYSRKTEAREPIRFGLGFARFHRTVFERIAALKQEDGQEIVDQYMHNGQLVRDFYPAGTDGEGRRHGEDGAFWLRLRLAGITPRIEQRTALIHWGRAPYAYIAPSIGSAQ